MKHTRIAPKTVGLIVFPNVTALDLVGPMEALTCAQIDTTAGKQKGYRVVVIGLNDKPVTAESGLVIHPEYTFRNAPALDTVIVPGGFGLREPRVLERVARWLQGRAPHTRRVASVCTGVYGLAATGLLDGKRAATHWQFARDVAQRFPKVTVDADALFLKQGKFYTSGGITASIDLTLSLIEEDYGPAVALGIARELVMHLRRSGGQNQFSEPLKLQMQSGNRFADLFAWILGHLEQDLTVESLSRRAGVCPRHLSRLFKTEFKQTPAAYVETLRIGEACRQLTDTKSTVERIASAVGFKSADAFRRSFQKIRGVTPTSYRQNFGGIPGKRARSAASA